MAAVAFRSEERIGLAAAVVLHAALVALLLLKPHAAPVVIPPDRISVTISDDVGLKSTSPEPNAKAAPDVAPDIGEPAPPPEAAAAPPVSLAPPPRPEPPKPVPPKPEPKPEPEPKPRPKPVTHRVLEPRPEPKPVPKPVMRPREMKPVAKPAMRPDTRPNPAPATRPSAHPSAHPSTRPNAHPADTPSAHSNAGAKPTNHEGGTRVGADFLKGVTGAQASGTAHNPPAEAAGPQVQASLLAAISRALRPHWQGKVPEGVDSEKLVTVLRWNLNRDGSLAGAPVLVKQEGITDANRPQAARHAEQAIRAVQLAAPFNLPAQYYDTWKRVTFRFDKRLSQ